MIKALTLVAVLLAVLPVSAQTVTDAPSLAVMDVIAKNGCSVSESEAAQLFPAAGFTRKAVRRITEELMNAGIIQLQNERLVLVNGPCNSGTDLPVLVAYQEQYISILRHNGCQLQTGEAGSLFPQYGMDANLAAELEEGLVKSGIANIMDGALHIGPEFCVPDSDFATAPVLEPDYEVQHLIEILEAAHCSIVQSEIDITFPQDGQSPEAAHAAVKSLLASGAALAVSGGDRVWISPEICKPWSERGH